MAEEPEGFYTDKQGRVRPRHGKKRSGALAGAAVTILLSAVTGGGAGGAAAASGPAEEFSLGVRIPQSQTAVRIRGFNDSLKVTFRLQRLGHYPTTLDAQSDTV